jgi:hypothetical protein
MYSMRPSPIFAAKSNTSTAFSALSLFVPPVFAVNATPAF